MDVFVLGFSLHPPAEAVRDLRLEEMVFETSRTALDDAGVSRGEIDSVTLAASDELDGKAITSMLLAAPAGAYLKDELRVTDSGLVGLCLGALRIASGRFDLGLVASWSQTSTGPVEDVMRMRAEPFFLRPVGMNATIADGLFASAVVASGAVSVERATASSAQRQALAAANPRGIGRAASTTAGIDASPCLAWPLRAGHRAPLTDGAASFVLASGRWLRIHAGHRPLARIAGLAWQVDSYRLDAHRLASLDALRDCHAKALKQAGLQHRDVDVVEMEAPTGFHDAALADAFTGTGSPRISPSGGVWAQNPLFCTGLVNAAESVLQVSDGAGPTQVPGARTALAHGMHGFAGQGQACVVFERVRG